jgi:hypothetical protein
MSYYPQETRKKVMQIADNAINVGLTLKFSLNLFFLSQIYFIKSMIQFSFKILLIKMKTYKYV